MSELKILVEYSVKENKLNDFLTEIKNNKIREKVVYPMTTFYRKIQHKINLC